MTTIPRLGPLELRVLVLAKRLGRAPTRRFADALRAEGGDLAYATVATVLRRLVARGFLAASREPHRGSFRYVYESLGREEDVLASMAGEIAARFGPAGAREVERRLAEVDRRGDRVASTFRALA